MDGDGGIATMGDGVEGSVTGEAGTDVAAFA